jgi:hypothetical protein
MTGIRDIRLKLYDNEMDSQHTTYEKKYEFRGKKNKSKVF